MAENENGQEKTEEPTPKRLKDSREKGDSPRSPELATAAVFVGALLALLAFGGWMAGHAMAWMGNQLRHAGEGRGLGADLVNRAGLSIGELMLAVGPLIVTCLLCAFVAPAVMGFNFSTEALTPNAERLSPIAGLKRIFGTQGLGELVKSLLRIAILGAIGTVYYLSYEDRLLQLSQLPVATAAAQGFDLILGLLIAMGLGLVLLAVADVPWQLWSWKRRLKMTRQELLEEMKEMEGRPEVKGHIRRMQQQLASGRMMEAVPTADVVVVNPTHYAVALKYDPKKAQAPIVVAKGLDEVALNIRKVASAHKVAIVEAPPLARVLHAQAELDREIPVKLYQAVAQVLSYVYQLKVWTPKRGAYPTLPDFGALEREP
ncbi:flagellar biosynthesis protein FlhB [Silanimonas sp.]|uniref:flagellar biosynthesis protein FlhB n=1 Tax=Silanimonas sp. TaxID=1929290 RepID=UPI0022C32FFB|nr:flagellar biosynthesis protein FlhB [Silanimonas sp.]MCZ8062235.1 flagellar biosynthesis protein FlhB [Silanimonas sp.]